jgi:hypothetical protein
MKFVPTQYPTQSYYLYFSQALETFISFPFCFFISLFRYFSSYFTCSSGVILLILSLSSFCSTLLLSYFASATSASFLSLAAYLIAFLDLSHLVWTGPESLRDATLSIRCKMVWMMWQCVSNEVFEFVYDGKVMCARKNRV